MNFVFQFFCRNLPTTSIYESTDAGKCNRGFRLWNPLIPKRGTPVADIGNGRCTYTYGWEIFEKVFDILNPYLNDYISKEITTKNNRLKMETALRSGISVFTLEYSVRRAVIFRS